METKVQKFNEIIQAIQGVLLILSISLAGLYLLSKDIKYLVHYTFISEKAWFYLGTFENGSYSEARYELGIEDGFNIDNGLIKQNTILVASHDIYGRTKIGENAGRVIITGKPGDCIVVAESKPSNKDPSAIWVNAAKYNCN